VTTYSEPSTILPSSDLIEVNSNINLEFNTALNLLHFTSLDMDADICNPIVLPWILRILSSINTSNRIEEITLGIITEDVMFEPVNCLPWKQVDRILADAQFQFLQKLVFNINNFDNGDDDLGDYRPADFWACTSIKAAFPLIMERGVSVEVRFEYLDDET
jgi:hypothetical protein